MIFLWVFLGLIGLIILLIHIPVVLRVKWDDDLAVRLRYLFISYTLYPTKKEESEPGAVRQYISNVLRELKEKRKKKKQTAPSTGEEKPGKSGWQSLRERKGFFGAISYMLRIVIKSAELMAEIITKSVISCMRLHITIGGDDAASIGITHGQWCAAVYPAVSLLLCSVRRYKNCDVSILPDFLSEENKYSIDFSLRVKPVHGLIGAVRLFVGLVKAETAENQAMYSLEVLKKAQDDE